MYDYGNKEELLDILPSITEINYNDPNIEMIYEQYLVSNRKYFLEYFPKVVYPLYYGDDVFIYVPKNDQIAYLFVELFFKFIKNKYQYKGIIINDQEDYDAINFEEADSFGIGGIYNLDIDKEIYAKILAEGVRFGGN